MINKNSLRNNNNKYKIKRLKKKHWKISSSKSILLIQILKTKQQIKLKFFPNNQLIVRMIIIDMRIISLKIKKF